MLGFVYLSDFSGHWNVLSSHTRTLVLTPSMVFIVKLKGKLFDGSLCCLSNATGNEILVSNTSFQALTLPLAAIL